MYNSYADVLESYIIYDIAEEGFGETVKNVGKFIIGAIKKFVAKLIQGITAIIGKLKNRKNKEKSNQSLSSRTQERAALPEKSNQSSSSGARKPPEESSAKKTLIMPSRISGALPEKSSANTQNGNTNKEKSNQSSSSGARKLPPKATDMYSMKINAAINELIRNLDSVIIDVDKAAHKWKNLETVSIKEDVYDKCDKLNQCVERIDTIGKKAVNLTIDNMESIISKLEAVLKRLTSIRDSLNELNDDEVLADNSGIKSRAIINEIINVSTNAAVAAIHKLNWIF